MGRAEEVSEIPDHVHPPARQLAVAHSTNLDPRLDRVLVQIADGPYTFAVNLTLEEAHALSQGIALHVAELQKGHGQAAKALRG